MRWEDFGGDGVLINIDKCPIAKGRGSAMSAVVSKEIKWISIDSNLQEYVEEQKSDGSGGVVFR